MYSRKDGTVVSYMQREDIRNKAMRIIRKALMILLLLGVMSTPVFANMPVIDISAITQGVTQFVQTMQQYQRQIQQWASEFQRLMKAAQNIASGDFDRIIQGITSVSSQMAGWSSTGTFMDNFLTEIGNTASMTKMLKDNGEKLYGSLQDQWTNFGNAISSISAGSSVEDVLGAISTGGSAFLNLGSDTLGNLSGSASLVLDSAEYIQQWGYLSQAQEMLEASGENSNTDGNGEAQSVLDSIQAQIDKINEMLHGPEGDNNETSLYGKLNAALTADEATGEYEEAAAEQLKVQIEQQERNLEALQERYNEVKEQQIEIQEQIKQAKDKAEEAQKAAAQAAAGGANNEKISEAISETSSKIKTSFGG